MNFMTGLLQFMQRPKKMTVHDASMIMGSIYIYIWGTICAPPDRTGQNKRTASRGRGRNGAQAQEVDLHVPTVERTPTHYPFDGMGVKLLPVQEPSLVKLLIFTVLTAAAPCCHAAGELVASKTTAEDS